MRPIPPPKEFLDNRQIVQVLFEHLEKDDIDRIKGMSLREMRDLHFTTGMWIRNHFKLWDENNPHTMKQVGSMEPNEEGIADSPYHPDQYSNDVLSKLWYKVQREA